MRQKQMSETIFLGAVLAAVGGFLDAYTYLSRGGVFANAQTGNIVLLGLNISEGNWIYAFRYLIPIGAFAAGVFVAEKIKFRYRQSTKIHWRQIIIGIEILLLSVVAFLPAQVNIVANITVSFVCAVQVDSFRKFDGNAFATTMCTGNLRSGTELLCAYLRTKDENLKRRGLQYYGIILIFVIGAGLGTWCTRIFGEKSVLFCCGFLILAFAVMFIKEKEED